MGGKSLDSKASAVDTRRECTAVVRLRYYILDMCCFTRDMFGTNWQSVRACTGLAVAHFSMFLLRVHSSLPVFVGSPETSQQVT